jgi:glycosyltransferase involved in cell wall biosynthesis
MKATIIGPAYPLRGGIAHHVYWLWRKLTERGHTIQVISFRQMYPRLLFPGTTETDASRLKLDCHAIPILTALNPVRWRKAVREVKAFAPDAVVFEWWQPFFGLLTGNLARSFRKARLKSIIECHNIVPHEGSPVDRLLSRHAFAPVDYFITHSAKDREKLLQVAPGKNVLVAPLPSVDEFSAASNSRRDGRTILFFGKVRKYKGLGVLIEAMPEVLAAVDCRLLIAGEFYEPLEKYEARLRELRIEDRVQIINRYVANEEVTAIIEQADVLVLPYVSASQSGIGRIALSNGLPIVASKVGGLPELVTDGVTGLLFEPNDADALAAQLIRYFSENLGPVFSRNISSSPKETGHKIIEFIESIMKDDPARSPALSYPNGA